MNLKVRLFRVSYTLALIVAFVVASGADRKWSH